MCVCVSVCVCVCVWVGGWVGGFLKAGICSAKWVAAIVDNTLRFLSGTIGFWAPQTSRTAGQLPVPALKKPWILKKQPPPTRPVEHTEHQLPACSQTSSRNLVDLTTNNLDDRTRTASVRIKRRLHRPPHRFHPYLGARLCCLQTAVVTRCH